VLKHLFSMLAVMLLGVGAMQAQTVTGTIVGTVLDSGGASVPNARITVLNQDTGITRSAVSTEEGQFRVPQLSSGAYTVSAEAPGLSKMEVKDVKVAVAAEIRVDLMLTVAATTTEVQVSGDAIAVNTENAAVSTLMTQSAIEQVPLNARDVQQLAIIQPGVQSDPNDNWGNQIVIAGSRPQQNRYLQEGIDTTWTSKTAPVSAAGVVLGVEAVKEFQVLESNYTAEYGERPGGTLNAIFKSGSNAWHGSAYEYLRNSWFDARSFFDPQSGPPSFKRNQFGSAFGGPIKKDKHFFYVNYEGYRHILGQSQTDFVPDSNARNGKLPCSVLASPKPASCTGQPGTTLATVPGFVPGGFIQGAINLLEPPCTLAPAGDGSCSSVNVTSQRVGENFVVSKLDFTLGAKDSLATSYKYDTSLSNSPQQNPNFNLLQQVHAQIFTARETHIFSPNFLNTLNFGFNRTFFLWNLGVTVPVPETINGGNPFTIPNGGVMSPDGLPVLPVVSITGLTSIGAFSSGTTVTPRWIGYTGGTLNDDVDILRGKHAFRFGVQYKKWDDNVYNSASTYQGTIAFQSLQNLLAGKANTFTQTIPGSDLGRGYRSWLIGLYGEDTYRVMSNLTLTLGLRWEMVPGPHESLNRLSNLYNPNTDKIPESGGTYFHGSPRNFEPRIGITWDPFHNGKTSVRAGFGIFHDEIEAYYYFIQEGHVLPYANNASLKASPPSNPLPSWPAPSISQLQALPTTNQAFAAVMPLYPKSPAKYSYNLEIQRQLPWKMIMSIGYVGSFGRNLGRPIGWSDYNPMIQAPGSTVGCDPTEVGCGCPPTATSSCLFWPGKGLKATQCSSSITTNCSTLNNPAWSTVSGTVFDSNSFYNSAEVRLQRQIASGVNLQFGYTHLSCWTDSSGETPGQALNGSTTPEVASDASSSRGRCAFTANDVGTLTLTYDIPFAKSSNSAMLKTLVGGWQISSLTDVSSGFPMNVIAGVNVSRALPGGGAGADRVNLKPGCTVFNAIRPRNPKYIDGNCLAEAQFGYLPNIDANAFTGPSFWSTDASLRKDFGLRGEKMMLRLQVDMFNIFNRTNLGTTTNSIGAFNSSGALNSAFGQITTIIGTPRQLQLGARFSF
jgi:outer membrane receptor protein involved in Fe transport